MVAGSTGLLPFDMRDTATTIRGIEIPAVVLVLIVMATALPYVAGLLGTRLIGSHLSSFVALSEVLFAVVFAWVLLGEDPSARQLLGGALIIAGVIVVRLRQHQPEAPAPARQPASAPSSNTNPL